MLINTRWRLNQLIDVNMNKHADVYLKHWKIVVAMRAIEAVQAKSKYMRFILKRKRSITTQMKAIGKKHCVVDGKSPDMLR